MDGPGRQDPVYFILHVPKTAGQTIELHLARHCLPGAVWRPGGGSRADGRGDPDRIRVVCGHDLGCSLESRFAGREIRRVVLLRDPLDLQLSLYNYRMMNYLVRGLGTYGFELHRQALPRDYVAHLLLAGWLEMPWPALLAMSDARKYAMLNRTLAGFWFVGDYSDCGRLLAALAADLGVPAVAEPENSAAEWARRVEWRPLRAEGLPAEVRAAIRAQNPMDEALWQSWRDAGFAARCVRPRPLGAPRDNGFLRHEIVRPGYLSARFARRDLLPWLRRRGGDVSRGDHARDAGQWALAARHYRAALEAMPKAPAIWVQYGHALKEAGDPAAAEAAYRRSLALDPDTADTWLQLGHALKLQGRLDEAANAYLGCLARDPASADAAAELARLGWPAARIAAALPGAAPVS